MFLKNFLKYCSSSMLGRIASLVRDLVFSATFGATLIADIFLVAFRFPNLLRTFFADGPIYGTLIPELSNKKNKIDKFDILNQFMSNMWVILTILTIIVEIFAPFFVGIMAPGYINSDHFQTVVDILRIVFPFLFLFSTNCMFISLSNSFGRFWLHPTSGVILCVSFIVSILYTKNMNDMYKLYHLAYTALIAGILQVLWFYMFCRIDGFKIKPKIPNFRTKETIELFKRMIKTSIASFGMHINTFMDVCLSSFLPSGSLSYLIFADKINLLCIELFGTSFGTILMPNFSQIKNDVNKIIPMLEESLLICIQIILPISMIIFVTSDTIIQLFFGRGNFTPENCIATSKILMCYAIGIPAFVITKLLMSFFFSQNKNGEVIPITFITVITNLIGNIILMQFYGCMGLAIATSFSMWIGVFIYFRKINKYYENFDIIIELIQITLWSTIHALYAYLLYTSIGLGKNNDFFSNLFGMFFIFTIVLLSYFYGNNFLNINYLKKQTNIDLTEIQ